MTDVKWIKLTVNVFDDEKFDAIRTQPDSNDLQLAWVKLLCLAGTCNENGFLVLTKEIPYTDEMLAVRFHMDIGVVQRAMLMFQKLNMIEVVDNAYMVSNWLKYQSGDRLEEIRRKDRERKAARKQAEVALLQGQNNEDKNSTEIPRKIHGNCSYSFSPNNCNIVNLNYLLNPDIYINADYILNNKQLLDSIKEWMTYKDERTPKSANRYTERGMKGLLTEIVKYDKTYGTDAVVETITHTMAGQWQGIVWDWMEKKFSKVQQKQSAKAEPSFANRPERWRTCPESTWQKLKPFASDDGSFDWGSFDSSVLNDYDREWMRQNNM